MLVLVLFQIRLTSECCVCCRLAGWGLHGLGRSPNPVASYLRYGPICWTRGAQPHGRSLAPRTFQLLSEPSLTAVLSLNGESPWVTAFSQIHVYSLFPSVSIMFWDGIVRMDRSGHRFCGSCPIHVFATRTLEHQAGFPGEWWLHRGWRHLPVRAGACEVWENRTGFTRGANSPPVLPSAASGRR